MFAILRQAMGVVIGGMIVAAITLAPTVSANDDITVAPLQTQVNGADAGGVNKSITYQGMLLDNVGQPVANSLYPMKFRIYNAPTGGTPIWGQKFDGVPVMNGMFTVLLDVTKDGNDLTVLFNGQDLYLAIAVDDESEASPRQPLLYVPYAHWARNADKLNGKGSKWMPLAYGVIDRETGGVVNGSGNFTSTFRDEDMRKYYEISITGVHYFLNDFVTIVTPISQKECPNPTLAHTNSEDGKLIIDLKDGNGNLTKCKFHFVTFGL